MTLTLADGTTTTVTIPAPVNAPGGSVLFYGYIDTAHPFVSAVFGDTATGVDYFGFDNMTIGSVQQVNPIVPEPTTMIAGALLLLPFGLQGIRQLRNRKQVA